MRWCVIGAAEPVVVSVAAPPAGWLSIGLAAPGFVVPCGPVVPVGVTVDCANAGVAANIATAQTACNKLVLPIVISLPNAAGQNADAFPVTNGT